MKHIKPSPLIEYFNNTKFTSVTQCKKCKTIAHYEDRHPVDPCPECGGKVKEKVGRYTGTHKPVGFLDLFWNIQPYGHWLGNGIWILKDKT